MREFDALKDYPKLKRVIPNRTIHHKILASYRGYHFFDGPREYGYGGLKDDGRWEPIAKQLLEEYRLDHNSTVMQLNCEKGYLLNEFHKLGVKVKGIESSSYARKHAPEAIRGDISASWGNDGPFDLIIAIGVVYSLPLAAAMDCIRRIEQGAFRSFITLASYDTHEELELFRRWTLLSCTILKKEEWVEVLSHCGFSGDYSFTTAKTLGLCES